MVKSYADAVAVAPFAGAWIEMVKETFKEDFETVAPFAGAWIEMVKETFKEDFETVAPFAGAWIEICYLVFISAGLFGRSLRGSVD